MRGGEWAKDKILIECDKDLDFCDTVDLLEELVIAATGGGR